MGLVTNFGHSCPEYACSECDKNDYRPDWIPITTLLPVNQQWVLAWNGTTMCVCWFSKDQADTYLFMSGMSSNQQFMRVTHWQKLPAPPQ